jgi:hypothetical protein
MNGLRIFKEQLGDVLGASCGSGEVTYAEAVFFCPLEMQLAGRERSVESVDLSTLRAADIQDTFLATPPQISVD